MGRAALIGAPTVTGMSKPSNERVRVWGAVCCVAGLAAAGCSASETGAEELPSSAPPEGLLASLDDRYGSESSDVYGDPLLAEQACQDAVLDRLKAPATAQFPDLDAEAFSIQRGQWVIAGAVDSENGFGAMIRTDYECRATSTADHWNAVVTFAE
jgi:hypothetical protein